MNRLLQLLYPAALLAALLALGAAAAVALRHHPVAFVVTLVIAGFFALGVWELNRFRRASQGLAAALDALATPPASADAWLAQVPATLRDAVRQRLDGLRPGLPGPVLAPTLAGLLVMMGMLGTFAGLAMTLGGTAQALGATADLLALRGALSAPLSGLGLAFSTSVAGVAASAMLGLMSLLARRERGAAAERLDAALAGVLRPWTAAQRRENAQAALPALLGQLAERLATQQGEFLQAWQQEQRRFHEDTHVAYRELAASVDRTLQNSLQESAARAGALLQPIAEATMAGIAREASALHAQLGGSVSEQLAAVAAAFQQGSAELTTRHHGMLDTQLQRSAEQLGQAQALLADVGRETRESLVMQAQATRDSHAQLHTSFEARLAQLADSQAAQQHAEASRAREQLAAQTAHTADAVAALQRAFATQSEALVQAVQAAQARQQQQHAESEAARLATWQQALQAASAALHEDVAAAAARQQAQQQQVAEQLAAAARSVVEQAEQRSQATLAEVERLLQTASEAPRAAGEVVAQLREQLSASLTRDNAALAERAQLLDTLGQLLAGLQQAAGAQREAIDALVARSASALDAVSARFTEQLDSRTQQLTDAVLQLQNGVSTAATHLAASAAEMGSLGEGFSAAVEHFQGASERLLAQLGQLDGGLDRALARSDEQMRYTVAQARELIDLCLMSQKQVLDRLQGVAEVAHG